MSDHLTLVSERRIRELLERNAKLEKVAEAARNTLATGLVDFIKDALDELDKP